ncbi:MAG: GTP 3',8-cyclase MoaA [Proteobacteria bacterium]|jgi:GTP 3',8-cyclase|nr:GTP 3',8-cyclase MoaA [Pseudomonadota bacterium]
MNYQLKAKPILVDPFGRTVNYLRISVTDRCNLRCVYCMAEDMTFLPREQLLNLEEIETIASAFVRLGVNKIRLTGGEPMVRNGIVDLCKKLSALDGLNELVMTTNGVLLDKYANELADAGVKRLNISLDSLQADRVKKITRHGKLEDVLRGIEAARSAGFERIKLNAVVLDGVNDDEVTELAEFALSRDLDITFIEEMPLGEINSHSRSDTQVASHTLAQRLAERYEFEPAKESTHTSNLASNRGPSRYHQVKGYRGRIGFISPMTDNFCSSCNRVRLTSEGRLLLCLGNEHSLDLRNIVRNNSNTDTDLQAAIQEAITRKPEKHHFDASKTDIIRFMNMTGG